MRPREIPSLCGQVPAEMRRSARFEAFLRLVEAQQPSPVGRETSVSNLTGRRHPPIASRMRSKDKKIFWACDLCGAAGSAGRYAARLAARGHAVDAHPEIATALTSTSLPGSRVDLPIAATA